MAEPQDFSVDVLRPDDLLVLRFEFTNLHLVPDGGGRLERADPEAPAYVVVVLPPQHINERAFFESDAPGSTEPLVPPPVASVMSGPSRLAFRIPDDMQTLPYTLPTLLNWTALLPSVAANALPAAPNPEERAGNPRPVPPHATETAIELPYRLVLSPNRDAAWTHATTPQGSEDRFELWHTQLAVQGRTVRAVWTPDWSDPDGGAWPPPPLPHQPLDSQMRTDIVRLSSDFGLAEPQGFYEPQAIEVRRLMLSALGGYLDVRGRWPQPQGSAAQPPLTGPIGRGLIAERARMSEVLLARAFGAALKDARSRPKPLEGAARIRNLGELLRPKTPAVDGEYVWVHRAQAGRDEFVQFERPGILYPLGHRASLVTITERKFEAGGAYLRQRNFIRISQATRDYRASIPAFPYEGRELPFTAIRFATLVTPNLSVVNAKDASFPMLGSEPYAFDIVGIDREGREAAAAVPLLFVPFNSKGDPSPAELIAQARPAYDAHPEWHTATVQQKAVAFAPIDAEKSGSTSATCSAMRFGVAADKAVGVPPGEAPVLPKMVEATVSLPTLAPLAGPAAAQAPTTIELAAQYLEHGVDGGGNPAHLYATLKGGLAAGMAPDRSGGVAAPSFEVQGLSRALGPIADVAGMSAGTFSPTEFLPSAKLLGALDLKDLIVGLAGLDAGTVVPPELRGLSFEALRQELEKPGREIRVPVMGTHPVLGPDGKPVAVETLYVWKPQIKNINAGLLALERGGASQFALSVYHYQPVGGGDVRSQVDGRLTDFDLIFAGVVRVHFGAFAFSSVNGAKLDVHVAAVDVTFEGALQFVQTIQGILPSDGFEDPPYLTVLPTGVTAGYTLGVPTLAIGVISIENLALEAGVSLPFTGDPSGVRFAISRRDHPFLVTVSLFGGGGFFALTVKTSGPPMVEAALEFGGNFSFDIGVASGNVHVMAGIYFAMLGSQIKLSGYLRMGGSLEVLGIVTVSVEFYLALDYVDGKAYGEATLTVSVDVLGFSKSVSLHVEKKFAGAAGDPTFAELVDPGAWREYCGAFA